MEIIFAATCLVTYGIGFAYWRNNWEQKSPYKTDVYFSILPVLFAVSALFVTSSIGYPPLLRWTAAFVMLAPSWGVADFGRHGFRLL